MDNGIIIIYIAVWVIMGLIMGAFGGQRKIGFASVFVLSLLFSPIIGGFAMLSSKRLEDVEFENKVLKRGWVHIEKKPVHWHDEGPIRKYTFIFLIITSILAIIESENIVKWAKMLFKKIMEYQ